MIDKTRYEVEFENQTYEVDEFYGENEGLTIAELEFESETASYSKPKWLGEEVTGDKRYSNSYLSQHPFKHWKS
jgi:adenylate cyclase